MEAIVFVEFLRASVWRTTIAIGTSMPAQQPKLLWRHSRTIGGLMLLTSVGYIASFGPAYWLVRQYADPWFARWAETVYWPLNMLMTQGPEPIADALVWYLGLWMPDRFASAT